MEQITRLGSISPANLQELQQLCTEYKRWMHSSNNYAPQRKELHIRRFVKLPCAKYNFQPRIELISEMLQGKYIKHFRDIDRVEALGERLLLGFHQGILMHYPEGSKMKRHRDHPIYAKGAAQVNISGDAILNIDGTDYLLKAGDCVSFNNTLPHSVKALSERWSLCFFKLKPKYVS